MSADAIPDHRLNSRFVQELKWALQTGDRERVGRLLQQEVKGVNATIELSNDDWMKDPAVALPPAVLLGLWSLEYKRELTSPLCIAAAQGYTDCVRYLLEHGARPNLAPGGKAALHEACGNTNEACAELLLEHGADPAQLNEEGLAPLHLCKTPQSFRCAKLLVRYGALVTQPSEDECETPLHVAAKHGLQNHAHLYLRYGADANSTSSSGETPLGAACAGAQSTEDLDAYLQLVRLLLIYGADPNIPDQENRCPLHKASRNAQHGLVELLLEHSADVNAMDYNGVSPLSNTLQNAVLKLELQPHLTVQTLLNHGSLKVWPLAFLKVLTSCAAAPNTVEILFNSYSNIAVTYKWVDAVPEEVYQKHQTFYESMFSLESKPRSLQHLCRSTVRKHCGKDCHLIIPRLPVPKFLQRYMLLDPEGVIY
ncbi:ankyrin repeat and SOCS box protein 18 isoform X2 [Amia ocellicauda]|uniref:ankyrin repeat and SOCS box protein 18 isoform X2 n=1 Tax=Amia ocellicauda TaxID=2972642 RepID=UPI0034649C20